ncbi:MAG TPA: hypothetical protein VFQ12_09745 [Thermoleophilaceae bacterium]|nr:hypothetical protein [Thermoleophilaceae bacterium]
MGGRLANLSPRGVELGAIWTARRSELGGRLVRFAGPIALWIVAGAMLIAGAASAGYEPLAVDTWDSEHYLSIAADGYELERCPADPRSWCGNAGWFPAYPWLVAAAAWVGGIPLDAVAIAASWLFALATLVLLRSTFLADLPRLARLGGLAFAAMVPGMVYHHAAFPLAMLGFFSTLALWLLVSERWVWAGAAAAVAAATYHLGLILVPVAFVYALTAGRPARRERWRRSALVGGLAALGPLVGLLAMRLQTGAWDAFLLVQEKYGHGLHAPGEALWRELSPLWQAPLTRLEAVPPALALVTTFVVVCVSLHVIVRRREATPADWLLLATAVLLWLVPLTQENVALYRTAAALVPAAPLVARLPAGAAGSGVRRLCRTGHPGGDPVLPRDDRLAAGARRHRQAG